KIRTVGRGNNDPTVVTPGQKPKTSSHQYHEYLLCWDCEQRFSRNGEEYVMTIAQTKGKMPLLEMLDQISKPTASVNGIKAYDAAITPHIDRDKLTYFALSVFWRASVITWRGPHGRDVRIELGPQYNEEVRRYLLGLTGLPSLAYLKVSVCTDQLHPHLFFAPCPALKSHKHVYTFMACGIDFVFGIGKAVPVELRRLSMLTGAKWITSSDCLSDHKYRMTVD